MRVSPKAMASLREFRKCLINCSKADRKLIDVFENRRLNVHQVLVFHILFEKSISLSVPVFSFLCCACIARENVTLGEYIATLLDYREVIHFLSTLQFYFLVR